MKRRGRKRRGRYSMRIAAYTGQNDFKGWFDGTVNQWRSMGDAFAADKNYEDITHKLGFDPDWAISRGDRLTWFDEWGGQYIGEVEAISSTTTGRRLQAALTTVAISGFEPDPPEDDGTNDLERKSERVSPETQVRELLGQDSEGGMTRYSDHEPPPQWWYDSLSSLQGWYDGNCNYTAGDWREVPGLVWVGGGC